MLQEILSSLRARHAHTADSARVGLARYIGFAANIGLIDRLDTYEIVFVVWARHSVLMRLRNAQQVTMGAKAAGVARGDVVGAVVGTDARHLLRMVVGSK